MKEGKLRVAFLHPDLGIGGAERLVVDAAVALQGRGHEVHFFTSHHDERHCFPETTGVLPVTVIGDWLPRSLFGRFFAVCAYLRMIVAALYLVLFDKFRPDVIFCDQISACIPFLRLFSSARIVFYCHFPDQLLAKRETLLQRIYRAPIDLLEEKTTGLAHTVVCNSRFTAGIFHDTFRSLKVAPDVLYPSLNTAQFDKFTGSKTSAKTFTFLSINRYERKKNLGLAIRSFARLKTASTQLIMAGGFDPRVVENIQHFEELQSLAKELGLTEGVDITFYKSPSDHKKLELLYTSHALLYTPSGEHFGIVPVEAMYCGLPVVAVNNGGPTETIVDGATGFLCEAEEDGFVEAMKKLVDGGAYLKERMGRCGKQRVLANFSFQAFGQQLDSIVRDSD